jgi:hypothetical protein
MSEPRPLVTQITDPELIGIKNAVPVNPDKERLDTFEEICDLERKYFALCYIEGRYNLPDLSPTERALAPITNPMHGVDKISNQFAPKLLDAYLLDDPDEALLAFRGIEYYTTDQQMALLVIKVYMGIWKTAKKILMIMSRIALGQRDKLPLMISTNSTVMKGRAA